MLLFEICTIHVEPHEGPMNLVVMGGFPTYEEVIEEKIKDLANYMVRDGSRQHACINVCDNSNKIGKSADKGKVSALISC